MGLFWRRKKEDFISLGLSAPDEAAQLERVEEEAARIEQVAQWKAESAPVVAEPEVVEPVAAAPETVKPVEICLLYTSPSPRDRQKSRMPSSA